jgi:hypothetical protein
MIFGFCTKRINKIPYHVSTETGKTYYVLRRYNDRTDQLPGHSLCRKIKDADHA